jgi:hypothetical protein
MKKILINVCFCLMITLPFMEGIAASSRLECPAYYPTSQNKLINVSVFNAESLKSDIFELAPAEETADENNDIVKQYWNDMHSDTTLKAFVSCSYLDTDKKITLEINRKFKMCKFFFPYPDTEKSTTPAQFFCE